MSNSIPRTLPSTGSTDSTADRLLASVRYPHNRAVPFELFPQTVNRNYKIQEFRKAFPIGIRQIVSVARTPGGNHWNQMSAHEYVDAQIGTPHLMVMVRDITITHIIGVSWLAEAQQIMAFLRLSWPDGFEFPFVVGTNTANLDRTGVSLVLASRNRDGALLKSHLLDYCVAAAGVTREELICETMPGN